VSYKLDCVVIGAGVIGLAVARVLAIAGREVVVIEAEPRIGTHASSRNSEVIHAGIYYPETSLKARLCVTGRKQLYRYCAEHTIGHKRIGKLIVATDESDFEKLRAIDEQARKNGVSDLTFLDAATIKSIEPNVVCIGAMLSPSTGIIDSHEFMTALHAELEAHNGIVLLNSEVTDMTRSSDGFELMVGGDRARCRTLVNAAGFNAQRLADSFDLVAKSKVPDRHLAKGHYFSYQGKSPFGHLIYPLPSEGGLGIHATNDLSGAARFGPDVTWVDDVDYRFDDSRKPAFVTAVRRYYPGLDEDRLVPAYTGIRAKVVGPGKSAGDFVIHGEADHGVPNLVNLYGIESPGLTASLAIAEYVGKLL